MALQIVEAACRFEPDMSRGLVVIESDQGSGHFQQAFFELESQDARHLALGYAARAGMGDTRINGNLSGIYPINSEGLSLELVRDEKQQPLPQTHARMQPHRYRVDVPVTRRLI